MSAETTAHTTDLATYRSRTSMNRLGLWLFLISDAFTFAGLLVARFVLWGDTRPHLEQQLGLIVTLVLLLSSFLMNRAETAARFGDMKSFSRLILMTIALGSLFVAGVVLVEWPNAPMSASENVYGAVFYLTTGLHAFHVFSGVIFLALVWNNARKGLYNVERHWPIEAATIYWHFVDVVWFFIYPALYLIGTAH